MHGACRAVRGARVLLCTSYGSYALRAAVLRVAVHSACDVEEYAD